MGKLELGSWDSKAGGEAISLGAGPPLAVRHVRSSLLMYRELENRTCIHVYEIGRWKIGVTTWGAVAKALAFLSGIASVGTGICDCQLLQPCQKLDSSMKTENGYLCGWIKKQSQKQKSHQKWWSPEV